MERMLTMTTTAVGSATRPATKPAHPRDLRRFWRVLAAVVLPLGPLLITLARGLMPYWTSDDRAVVVATSLAQPGRLDALLWLGFLAVPLLLLGVLAIGYLTRRGAPVLATVGTMLTFAAFAGIGALGSTDAVTLAGSEVGLDPATLERLLLAIENHPVNGLGVGLFVIGHILGLVLLGIALRRARVVPLWVAVATAVSQPVHFVSAVLIPSRLLDVVLGWGLTTVAFAAIGLAILRMRDDDWDQPPVQVSR